MGGEGGGKEERYNVGGGSERERTKDGGRGRREYACNQIAHIMYMYAHIIIQCTDTFFFSFFLSFFSLTQYCWLGSPIVLKQSLAGMRALLKSEASSATSPVTLQCGLRGRWIGTSKSNSLLLLEMTARSFSI